MKRTSKTIIFILVLAIIVAVFFIPLLIGKSVPRSRAGLLEAPPSKIGEMSLFNSVQGEEALESINRLHGKKIKLHDGIVAHYEKDGKMAMVWIGLASDKGEATALINQMVGRIRGGSKVFSFVKQFKTHGTEIFQLSGMGQRHFIYQKSDKVVWVSLDRKVKTKFLTDAMATVK